MLKISTIDSSTECRLVLEGAVIAPWVVELKSAWQRAFSRSRGRTVVLDFHNVTQISPEAEKVLAELIKDGAKFVSGGVLIKHILQQLARDRRATALTGSISARPEGVR